METKADKANGENSDGARAIRSEVEEAFEVYARPPGVTRVNRRAVMVIVAASAGVISIAFLIGFGGNRSGRSSGPQELPVPAQRAADQSVLDGLPKDYTFDVNKLYEGVGYDERRAAGPSLPASRPVSVAGPDASELATAAAREREFERLRKEQEAAWNSPIVFASSKGNAVDPDRDGRTPSSETAGTSSQELFTGRSRGWNFNGTMGDDAPERLPPDVRRNLQSEKERFLTDGAKVEPYLKKPLIPPVSPYELKAGTVIPGMLVTGISTDLPGEVIGQVTENVYDTATGRYLLVPQGSRLLGRYSSLISNGQNRALIVWNRLILPDGGSVVLEGMPGTDAAGRSGLKDQVDYHLDRVGGAVALSTAISYAGNLARGGNRGGGNGRDSTDVIGDTVAQEGARVGQRLVDRELDVQPTITVRPGWPFRVLVNKDVILAPYAGDR